MNAERAATPQTIEELMAQALALEREAVERYKDLADVMQTHNNHEVAALFCALADQEALHAEHILRRMGWKDAPPTLYADETPLAPAMEDAHYLMQPWHALQIALAAERHAHDFFAHIAERCDVPELRNAAIALQAEESDHIAIIQSMLQRVPEPAADWAEDPDPPRYND